MWKIFTPFLAPVNSREKDEHPSYSRANYVPQAVVILRHIEKLSFLPGRRATSR